MAKLQKTLHRIPSEAQILGVCAGLAEYFDIDVTLVRIIAVALAFVTGGMAVLAYLVFAIVIPADSNAKISDSQTFNQFKNEFSGKFKNYFGLIFIILGIWILLAQFFPFWYIFRFEYIWPVVLIVVGILILTKKR